jgi:hypothetical protein
LRVSTAARVAAPLGIPAAFGVAAALGIAAVSGIATVEGDVATSAVTTVRGLEVLAAGADIATALEFTFSGQYLDEQVTNPKNRHNLLPADRLRTPEYSAIPLIKSTKKSSFVPD